MINNIKSTNIENLIEFNSNAFSDNRGLFISAYKAQELIFKNSWGSRKISQINISRTSSVGVVRGLHYQLEPFCDAKIVRCIKGKVWDVAVDLRRDSNTFLQWYSTELSPEKGNALLIPENFAHGFQVLAPNSELLYIHSNIWVKESESGIRYDDPTLAINWPQKPIGMSNRDLSLPFFNK